MIRYYKKHLILLLLTGIYILPFHNMLAQCQENDFRKGELLYSNDLKTAGEVKDWIMEGPGKIEFKNNWMHMYSPGEEFHHVFWCPKEFPGSFIAEWELQNLETDAGLCIIFFSAKGLDNKDIFDPSLPERTGVFRDYTRGSMNAYHISYYANGKDKPGREISHLRKNKGFYKVMTGEPGIPVKSQDTHKVTLIKKDDQIIMLIDDRKIIDWKDDGTTYGPVLQGGKMGFRQMQWTHFRYRNFRVWSISK